MRAQAGVDHARNNNLQSSSSTVLTPFTLIAFRFPPCDRIGAYRWSKLCGRLARLGHEIDVLCAAWPQAPDPGWFGDVRHQNIRVHRVPSLYPHQLRSAKFDARVLQKAHGRFFRFLDRVSPTHDVASLWGCHLLPTARRLLAKRDTRLVIATGAPFSANYWAARLKPQLADIKLIQDFRDPWLTSADELRTSSWARPFRLATESADLLVSVTPEMTALYQRLSGCDRVATVPNGVELARIRQAASAMPVLYDFGYIGNLFNGRDRPLLRFLSWVREKRQAGDAPRTVLAGLYPNSLPSECRDLLDSGHLTLRPHLPQEQAFQLLAGSRIALHFSTPGAVGTFQTTTKLVEHAALARPTLSLNYGGATADFIRTRRLGWSLSADSPTLFAELDACWRTPAASNFEVCEFDFDNTARLYSSLIERVAKG